MDIMSRVMSYSMVKEAIEYLNGLQLTVQDIKVLAEQSKVRLLGQTKKSEMINWLVKSTLGSQLDAAAIQRI